MRKNIVTAALVAGLLAGLPYTAFSQALTEGQVTKVDESARKITLRHGPMKKLDMPDSMTMVYAVKDPGMLKQVKAGDKVKFDADRVNGQLTVIRIEKAQ